MRASSAPQSRVANPLTQVSDEWIQAPEILADIDLVAFNEINAAEAIEGEGNIHIELHGSKNKQAYIKISDNGCGMSQDDTNLIFDPFFTTKASGTGLGLSIVHRILEAYDVLLDVESEINKGTTFTLQFQQLERPAKSLLSPLWVFSYPFCVSTCFPKAKPFFGTVFWNPCF